MPDAHHPPQGLPPVPTQMVYAVRGTDRISGESVSTVLEAPSVAAARRIADQKSLDVVEVTLMHPLNGAAALKTSRANPHDRFNTSGSVTQLATDKPVADAPRADTSSNIERLKDIDPPAESTAVPTAAAAPVSVMQRPAGFSGPTTNDTRKQRPAIPGSVAAAFVLCCVGGLLYFTVLRDQPEGGLLSFLSVSPHHAAAESVRHIDVAGPTDVDKLIAASQNPVSTPMLPRSQRGPGRSAYSTPTATPTPTARPARVEPAERAERAERVESAEPLVLTGISRGGKGQRATAIINGEMLRPGQVIGGHTLIQILDDSVVLEASGHIVGLGITQPPTETP